MTILHPAFTLVEGGRSYAAQDFSASVGVIDVTRSGAAGVVSALLGTEATGTDIYLMRDAASPAPADQSAGLVWLQTSGTTGMPKWARHSLTALAARIAGGKGERARWLLTFNPGSFAGVQVILSAMIGGHELVAPAYGAAVGDMADLAVAQQVTHVSGTPTFWRAFLMALGHRAVPLQAVTLGGEAADQAILDALKVRFPEAILRHIYATTEAGTVFSVSDGSAGFPAEWLGERGLGLSDQGTLTVRGRDTSDVIDVVDGRALFRGRIDAMVNVGGVKVYPESVEAHLLQLPSVREVRVSARPNPITGHMLVADIVSQPFSAEVEAEIKAHLALLPRSHRPASIRYVEAIEVGATGKKLRT